MGKKHETYLHRYYAGGWFRVLGWGIAWRRQDRPDHPFFSERYGYKKALHLFGWCLQGLGPRP